MRVVKLVLDGYKRFRAQQTLRLDGKLIAIVGPNEAGKTSVIRAFSHVGSRKEFSVVEKDRELSRLEAPAADRVVLAAVFALDPVDTQQLREHLNVSGVSAFRFEKRADGSTSWHLGPGSRLATHSLAADEKAAIGGLVSELDRVHPQLALRAGLLSETRAAVEAASPRAASELRRLESEWRRLDNGTGADSATEVADLLASMGTQYDAAEKQELLVLEYLSARIPVFREFTEEDRELRSSYAVLERQQKKTKRFPDKNQALENLLLAAGEDPNELASAVENNYQGQVQSWTERANDRLTTILNDGWTQSDIRMRLRVDGQRLAVLAGPEGDYSPVEDHSAGLRVFIALACLLQREKTDDRGVVVLIDEAEQHLHYDAQADLVVRLTAQQYAQQIIYTTHSAGCLPEDLGSSIRAVEPDGDSSSRIRNNIWHHGRPGVSTLHFALGASTFARSGGRCVVFTEGVSDCVLLPRLLREASRESVLGFQVVPGVSDFAEDEVNRVTMDSSRVAFVLDGDDAGLERQTWLVGQGACPERVFRLPDGHVIEDLVLAEVYVAAVSHVLNLERAGGAFSSMLESVGTNRPLAVKNYCAQHGLVEPGKRLVATTMLDFAESNATPGLLDTRFVEFFRELLGDLRAVLR